MSRAAYDGRGGPASVGSDRFSSTHVLVISGGTSAALTKTSDLADVLSDEERRRAMSIRTARNREDFVAAHLLVRLCAGRYAATDPRGLTLQQRCSRCGGHHGAPYILEMSNVSVSIAHSPGYVAVAVGEGAIGVDTERLSRGRRVTMSVLTSAEAAYVRGSPDPYREYLRLWTLKEALIKAGRASIDRLHDVNLVVSRNVAKRYDDLRLTIRQHGDALIATALPANRSLIWSSVDGY